MSLIPAFKIGLWNAWILQVCFFLMMFVQDFLMSKEARKRTEIMKQLAPFNKTEKILSLSTHVVIMPFVFVYSIFLPLKTGSVWLYIGLAIFMLALIIQIATIINVANTQVDKPVTRGVYKILRHPIYFSGFLMYLGTGIACASWIILLCAFIWIVFWHIVVPAEERFLLEKYGNAYRKYMNRTPRWIGILRSGK